MSAAFLIWYLLYVLLASYAPGFMSIKVLGNINVGLIFGLLQFVSTFVITDDLRAVRQPAPGPGRRPLREQIEAELVNPRPEPRPGPGRRRSAASR